MEWEATEERKKLHTLVLLTPFPLHFERGPPCFHFALVCAKAVRWSCCWMCNDGNNAETSWAGSVACLARGQHCRVSQGLGRGPLCPLADLESLLQRVNRSVVPLGVSAPLTTKPHRTTPSDLNATFINCGLKRLTNYNISFTIPFL